jgi:hypothetical protein
MRPNRIAALLQRRLAIPAALCAMFALLAGPWREAATTTAQVPVRVAIDAPADGSSVGPEFTVRGWAVADGASAPGVDTVALYADGEGDDRGRYLGTAAHGLPRPDVAAALGDPRLVNVGYELRVSLPPGEHWLAVYARASETPDSEGWSAPAVVSLTVVAPTPGPTAPPRAGPAVPATLVPSVTGGSVCTSRAPGGACLAYSAASGGIGMVCSEQNAQGECTAWAQSYSVNTACAQYGEGGQCLVPGTSPAANPPPGGAGQTTAVCLGYNSLGQCTRYGGQPVPDPTGIRLSAQQSGTAAMLTWSTFPGATTYELLRCPAAQITNCSTIFQSGATSYTLPTRQNYWYVVRARGADGQPLATSNLLGPL